jgi:hypothetical protein
MAVEGQLAGGSTLGDKFVGGACLRLSVVENLVFAAGQDRRRLARRHW